MDTVKKNARRILFGLALFFALVFLLFIINQFVLVYDLLARLNSSLAIGVTSILAFIIIYILFRLTMLWFKMPKVLVLSENPTEDEYSEYLKNMLALLKKNTHLKAMFIQDQDLSDEEKVKRAFDELDRLSMPVIKSNASAIFMTTAISQNGSLDSVFVLTSLLKMIWQLARIYETRPSLKSMGKLYLQVASVVFMARTIEDSDLIEDQIEPLVAALFGESLASAIPGMVPVTNLIVSSVLEGSLNAYLTLRVGVITQMYLGMETPQSKSLIRRSASVTALAHLGTIVKENGSQLVKTMGKSAKKAGKKVTGKWFRKSES